MQIPEIKLVGLSVRTSTKDQIDNNTIGNTVTKYFSDAIANQIENRTLPGKTYCVYTDYESNEYGAYTYFIGEEVTEIDTASNDLSTLIIPAQNYIKFTSESGAMPNVCISLWLKIWAMNKSEFGHGRAYIADFEVYDERAIDPQNTVLDIYVGIID